MVRPNRVTPAVIACCNLGRKWQTSTRFPVSDHWITHDDPKKTCRAVLSFGYRNRKTAVFQNDKLAPAGARTLSYPRVAYHTVALLSP